MGDGVLWKIVSAACLLLLVKSWFDRPRPVKHPVTITMSQPAFTRDSVLGTAYVEFRSYNPQSDGHSPECRQTPGFALQHRVAGMWVKSATQTRTCAPHQVDPALDASTTWHIRVAVPGTYRILLHYRPRGGPVRIAGPEFVVR